MRWLALLLLGCSGAQVSQECSDTAYATLVAECSAAAARCVAQGGNEDECGTVCDEKADQWEAQCQ